MVGINKAVAAAIVWAAASVAYPGNSADGQIAAAIERGPDYAGRRAVEVALRK